jgi:hypothetical protein
MLGILDSLHWPKKLSCGLNKEQASSFFKKKTVLLESLAPKFQARPLRFPLIAAKQRRKVYFIKVD